MAEAAAHPGTDVRGQEDHPGGSYGPGLPAHAKEHVPDRRT